MLRELFIHIAVFISLLFIANYIFSNLNAKKSAKFAYKEGIVYGIMGIVMMQFTITAGPHIFIDMRQLPIMLATLYGTGWQAPIVAGLLVGLFRLMMTDMDLMALIGMGSVLLISVVCLFIGRRLSVRWVAGLLMLVYMAIQNGVIFLFIMKDTELFFRIWINFILIFLSGGILVLYAAEYLRRSNDLLTLLQNAKDQMEAFLLYSADAIMILDQNRNVRQVNRAFETLYGWTEKEIRGGPLPVILPEKEMMMKEVFDRVSGGESVIGLETVAQCKNGHHRYVAITISPIWDEEKQISSFSIVSLDITNRKKQEEALRLSEAKYRYIAENTTDLIVVSKPDGRIEYASPSHQVMIGYSQEEIEEIRGEKRRKLIHPDDLPLLQDTFIHCVEAKQQGEVEFRIHHKTGVWVYLDTRIQPVLDEQGEVESLLIICRDVSERKRTEELLQKSEKLSIIGELAAGIAHEIRNPLTTLKGFIQLLGKDTEHTHYFELMFSELERIEMITNEFLALAKPQVRRFRECDVQQLLTGVTVLLGAQALLNNIEIKTEYTNTPMITCEENQLKQVFINIIKNAMEAMPDGGCVTIKVRMAGERVKISITDSGCGIPAERIARLGEPFYTLKEKGTGLGLMICFKFIKEHGGELLFSSQIGRGTTVDILLPVRHTV
ncbi:two-component system sporulation sensor kinase A [Aneurinibacillus soli]|uniref:histidine kinase n=2 Tax=Aneurinibacillus soli TaxID=1500254 RepID=A0A0U5B708_9BACL|nr:two-component system sporulation sensor kinase A [Aneurinibacillus soli]BAU26007.1 Sporulation kinase E [Aneurinibacillus soli]